MLEKIWRRILALCEKIPDLRRPDIETRELVEVYRVGVPGQVLRFPDVPALASFVEVRGLQGGDYEHIVSTDPLGFDEFWGGATNPKNLLTRAQLPDLLINMTTQYNPYVARRFDVQYPSDVSRTWFMPMMSRNWPWVALGSYVYARELPGASSFQTNWLTMTSLGAGKANIVVFASSSVYSGLITDVTLRFPSGLGSFIAQSVDVTQPSLGFFWFNDGRNGQLELPKDERCREQPLIVLKKFVPV